MKTLKFKRDFDLRVTPTLIRAFKKGSTYDRVTESDAKAALDAGAAEEPDLSKDFDGPVTRSAEEIRSAEDTSTGVVRRGRK